MGRPTSNARSAWTRFVARWIGALLLVIVTAQSSLAWAFPCLGHDCCDESEAGDSEAADSHGDSDDAGHDDADDSDDSDSDDSNTDGDDEGGCSCPLPCRPCCAGNVPPVLLPTIPPMDLPIVGALRILVPLPDTPPPLGTCAEILHVPKAFRA